MVYGVYAWRKRLNADASTISPRSLTWKAVVLIAFATVIGAWLVGWGLAAWTDDTQPYLDAYTTVPALVAQVLMILVYREHWFVWLAVDLFSVSLLLPQGIAFLLSGGEEERFGGHHASVHLVETREAHERSAHRFAVQHLP